MNHISALCLTWSDTTVKKVLKNQRLGVAVSGGLDSTVLLWNIWSFAKNHPGLEIFCAHVNFGLRGEESEGDERFLRGLCRDLNIPLFVKKASHTDRPIRGIQEWARNLRHQWFRDLLEDGAFLALGHNRDDLRENSFFRSLRGYPEGSLLGMSERDQSLIRPLLGLKRSEIEAFATQNKISWREDSSNSKNIYARNIIRNEIFPALEKASPGVVESLFKIISQNDVSTKMALPEARFAVLPHTTLEIALTKGGFLYFENLKEKIIFVASGAKPLKESSVILREDGIYYGPDKSCLPILWSDLGENKLPVGDLLIWKRI
ncbi:MAG: tRNA lysidine(34) synthetase TilS [Pseudomonadota bacterium]